MGGSWIRKNDNIGISYVHRCKKKRLKDTNCNIPILISLGVLTDSKYTIKQYICDKLDISIDMCETLLDDGKINLFLDGVNEIPSDTGGILKTVRMREIKQLIKIIRKRL